MCSMILSFRMPRTYQSLSPRLRVSARKRTAYATSRAGRSELMLRRNRAGRGLRFAADAGAPEGGLHRPDVRDESAGTFVTGETFGEVVHLQRLLHDAPTL